MIVSPDIILQCYEWLNDIREKSMRPKMRRYSRDSSERLFSVALPVFPSSNSYHTVSSTNEALAGIDLPASQSLPEPVQIAQNR